MVLIIILLCIVVAVVLVIVATNLTNSDTGKNPPAGRHQERIGAAGAIVAWSAASHLSHRHHSDNDRSYDSAEDYDYHQDSLYEDGYENGYDDAYNEGYDIYEEYEEANDPEEYEDSY